MKLSKLITEIFYPKSFPKFVSETVPSKFELEEPTMKNIYEIPALLGSELEKLITHDTIGYMSSAYKNKKRNEAGITLKTSNSLKKINMADKPGISRYIKKLYIFPDIDIEKLKEFAIEYHDELEDDEVRIFNQQNANEKIKEISEWCGEKINLSDVDFMDWFFDAVEYAKEKNIDYVIYANKDDYGSLKETIDNNTIFGNIEKFEEYIFGNADKTKEDEDEETYSFADDDDEKQK